VGIAAQILHYNNAKKGFGIQQWVPHQKQKFRAIDVAIAASTSA